MVDEPIADLHSIEILLVEDDPGDTLLITDALEHHKVRNRVTCVIVRQIDAFFLTVAKLPRTADPAHEQPVRQ